MREGCWYEGETLVELWYEKRWSEGETLNISKDDGMEDVGEAFIR